MIVILIVRTCNLRLASSRRIENIGKLLSIASHSTGTEEDLGFEEARRLLNSRIKSLLQNMKPLSCSCSYEVGMGIERGRRSIPKVPELL